MLKASGYLQSLSGALYRQTWLQAVQRGRIGLSKCQSQDSLAVPVQCLQGLM